MDLFYEKVLDDDRLKHFFEGTNMMRLVIKQVSSIQKCCSADVEAHCIIKQALTA